MTKITPCIESSSVAIADLRLLGSEIESLNSANVLHKATATKLRKHHPKTKGAKTRILRKPWVPGIPEVVQAWDVVNVYLSKYPLVGPIAGITLKGIYDICRKWVKSRQAKPGTHTRLSIYGPDGKVFKTFDAGGPRKTKRLFRT